jgi:hypothetical protein
MARKPLSREEAWSLIGKLVQVGVALDTQVGRVLLRALHLERDKNIEWFVVAESLAAVIDCKKKTSMLKLLASKKAEAHWKDRLTAYASAVERVMEKRNVAAHYLLAEVRGRLVMVSQNPLNLIPTLVAEGEMPRYVQLYALRDALGQAEKVHAMGEDVLARFAALGGGRRRSSPGSPDLGLP